MNLSKYEGFTGAMIANDLKHYANELSNPDLPNYLREQYGDVVKELVVVSAIMSLTRGVAN